MTSHSDEQKLRADTFENDRKLREQQGSTFLDHARSSIDDEAGGRFAPVQPQTVIGSAPIPQYPQASTPFQSDPVPVEPPLGYSVDELERPVPFSAVDAQVGPASDAPSSQQDEQRGVGPSSSIDEGHTDD
jgi:hypothetical protein